MQTRQIRTIDFKEYEAAARALKIQLQSLEVRGPNPDFEGAFQAAAKGRASALITVSGSLLNRYTKRIADLAIKNRLPSMYEGSEYVEAGGLMSYAANDARELPARRYLCGQDSERRQARRPARRATDEVRVRHQSKTAKQIGLTIPPNVLARADKVIKVNRFRSSIAGFGLSRVNKFWFRWILSDNRKSKIQNRKLGGDK